MVNLDYLTEGNVRTADPLALLQQLGGYYECPKNTDGKRLGPLVGYAGKYDAGNGVMKQYVGDVYANFARAERLPQVLMGWSQLMEGRLSQLRPTVIMGMPMGGLASAFAVAYVLGCGFVFPEKKVQVLATTTSREKAILALARHELNVTDRVILAEDVCNNFATTSEAIRMVQDTGARVVGISCWLNRSTLNLWERFPVESLAHKVLPEYKQEDTEVAADIAAGNVVWKPKDEWTRLMAIMNYASA